MCLKPEHSSNYLETIRAIQQNFDLMSQAVQESERHAKDNFFVNRFDMDQLISTRSSAPAGATFGIYSDSDRAGSRQSAHRAEVASVTKSRNFVADHQCALYNYCTWGGLQAGSSGSTSGKQQPLK